MTSEATELADLLKGGTVGILRNGDLDVLRSDQVEMIVAALLAAKPGDEGVSVFMPPDGDVSALGKEYLERRVSSMTESVDRELWRQEDGEAGRPEYWIGRLHEAKIALSNLTQGLERRGDSFGRASTTGNPKP